MPDYSLFEKTLRAAALGKSEEAIHFHEQIPQADIGTYNVFILMMFGLALDVRFEDDASLEAIRAFGDEMRYDYRNVEPPLQQHLVEGLIRSMAGEEHLAHEISPEEQYRIQLMGLRKIVGESPEMQENLSKYLSEASGLTREWKSEEG